MSIEEQIQDKVIKEKDGTIFLTEDFFDFGNANALRVSLHRLVKRGILYRLVNGIFVKPKVGKLLNKIILPNLDDVAQAIAKRDKARIIPTGSFALYSLGLSEQIPLNIVYYTDGRARKIKIDNGTISFKKASPKKISIERQHK